MREFDGRGLSWRVETLYERDFSAAPFDSENERFHRKTFEMAWGEQYEFTSMLPLAWKLIGTTDTRIRPSSRGNQRDPSWWFTPLHLLGLGLGWTDIGKGLYEWQRQSYPKGNPVLDFVFNTWGESIGALQTWLRLGYFTESIEAPLADLRGKEFEGFRLAPYEFENVDDFCQREIENLKGRGVSGRRLELANQLLFGGSDPFHLSSHFKGSVWPNEDENHMAFLTDDYAEEDNDAWDINPAEYRYEAHFNRYAGFHVQLNVLAAGMMTGEVFTGKERVRVHINNFGYLGEFMRHGETRRWYLVQDSIDESFTDDVHRWGN